MGQFFGSTRSRAWSNGHVDHPVPCAHQHFQFRSRQCFQFFLVYSAGKSLSEVLLFAEHGENMLCTKIVLNVRNNFCTQHLLPRFELGIFMY